MGATGQAASRRTTATLSTAPNVTGAWYRIGFASAGDYTSGSAAVEMAQ